LRLIFDTPACYIIAGREVDVGVPAVYDTVPFTRSSSYSYSCLKQCRASRPCDAPRRYAAGTPSSDCSIDRVHFFDASRRVLASLTLERCWYFLLLRSSFCTSYVIVIVILSPFSKRARFESYMSPIRCDSAGPLPVRHIERMKKYTLKTFTRRFTRFGYVVGTGVDVPTFESKKNFLSFFLRLSIPITCL